MSTYPVSVAACDTRTEAEAKASKLFAAGLRRPLVVRGMPLGLWLVYVSSDNREVALSILRGDEN